MYYSTILLDESTAGHFVFFFFFALRIDDEGEEKEEKHIVIDIGDIYTKREICLSFVLVVCVMYTYVFYLSLVIDLMRR